MIHKITSSVESISGWNVWVHNLMNQQLKIQVQKVVKPTNKNVILKLCGLE